MSTTNAPAPAVWPTLRAHDARALIDFLVAAFGFVETVSYTADDGRVAHAELRWPLGGAIMLGDHRGGDDDRWALRPGTVGTYVVTADAASTDALFERAVAAGAIGVAEPYGSDHGSHDCTLADPEGNLWQFGTYAGHPG